MRKFVGPLLVAVVLLVVQAGANVVTSISGGTVFTMPAVNYFGGGPQTVAPGVTWSSTNAFNQGGSVFGYNQGYDFLGNGSWDSALVMAGLNDSYDNYGSTDTMTFAFANPVSAVGGFLNYAPGGSTPTTIAVYDSSCDPQVSVCTPIESFNLTFLTGGGTDTGAFYGFKESTRNISYFTLTDNYVGITGLTAVIPEPSSLLLIGTGLLGVIGYGRRRLDL